MSRRTSRGRRSARGANTVSLFPFLAVLICTMGALILLLVVISEHTKSRATEEVDDLRAEKTAELDRERGILDWRITALHEARAKTEEEMAEARKRLALVEQDLEKRREDLEQLQAALKRLRETEVSGDSKQGDVKQAIAQLEAEVERARDELAKKREEAADRPPRYAILPFDTRYNTRRRPVYLECRADGVYLQPEDVQVIGPQDLVFLNSPSNTLDRVLRAVGEYWEDRYGGPMQAGEPYPLLLIRPSGIEAYYAARQAMAAWSGEFGYEPIEEEIELEFPEPDTALRNRVGDLVERTREHQRQLVRVMPAVRALEQRNQPMEEAEERYVVSAAPGGGIVRSSPDFAGIEARHRSGTAWGGRDPLTGRGGYGASGAGGATRSSVGYEPGGGPRIGIGGPTSSADAGVSVTGPLYPSTSDGDRFSRAAATSTSAGAGTGTYAPPNGLYPSTSDGDRFSRAGATSTSAGAGAGTYAPPNGLYPSTADGEHDLGGGGSYADPGGQPSGAPSGLTTNNALAGLPTNNAMTGNAPGRIGAPNGSPGGEAVLGPADANSMTPGGGGSPFAPPSLGPATGGGSPSLGMSNAGGADAGGESCPNGMGMPSLGLDLSNEAPTAMNAARSTTPARPTSHQRVSVEPLADARGRNWALPSAMAGGEVARPIRVDCYADRLLVVPERGYRGGRDLRLHGPLDAASADQLVTGVWEQMGQWGSAGIGMQWRPLLNVHVMPGGETRFAELSALFAGSGMEIEQSRSTR